MIAPHHPTSLFGVQAGEYENFTLTASTADTLTLFVVAVCIGIVIAALYNFYLRTVPGGIVRALLRAEALSPESAKTAAELGLEGKALHLLELTRGSALRRVVRFVGDTADAEGNRPPQTPETRYYIPEEAKYRAELRFEKKGNGIVALLFTAALSVVLGALIIALLPWFLGVIDKLM
jgi:hypothetical protein